jgi:hypothetical protein
LERDRYAAALDEASLKTITAALPPSSRAAVVRWFRPGGKSDAASFASEPMPFPLVTESRMARRFPYGGLLRSAVVTARALKDITGAL